VLNRAFTTLAVMAGLAIPTATPTAAHAQTPGDHAGHLMAATAGETDGHGIVVDFELVDAAGRRVTDEDFRGLYVLLGFGFTNCTSVCPLMALNMGRVLQATDKTATGIFVSVDTERDTPAITHAYASRFDDGIVGLGGSLEQINEAAKNFKVSYAVTKTQDSYTVQHTANVFLIDPEGRLAEVFTFATPPARIVEAIR
jgi:protein SCO1/2